MSKLIDIKQELESLMPYLEGSTQGEAVKFCIRILGERWEVGQQRDALAALLTDLLDNATKAGVAWYPDDYRSKLAAIMGKEGV